MTELDKQSAERAMRKIKAYQAKVAEYEEAIDNLKDALASSLPEGDTILGDEDYGYLKATVYRSKQFNEAYGKKNSPSVWEKAAETKRVVTTAHAKEVLTADEYALFQKPSAKVSVKVEVISD